jgi:hypothetical protein
MENLRNFIKCAMDIISSSRETLALHDPSMIEYCCMRLKRIVCAIPRIDAALARSKEENGLVGQQQQTDHVSNVALTMNLVWHQNNPLSQNSLYLRHIGLCKFRVTLYLQSTYYIGYFHRPNRSGLPHHNVIEICSNVAFRVGQNLLLFQPLFFIFTQTQGKCE